MRYAIRDTHDPLTCVTVYRVFCAETPLKSVRCAAEAMANNTRHSHAIHRWDNGEDSIVAIVDPAVTVRRVIGRDSFGNVTVSIVFDDVLFDRATIFRSGKGSFLINFSTGEWSSYIRGFQRTVDLATDALVDPLAKVYRVTVLEG